MFYAKNVTNQTFKVVFDSLPIVLIYFRADELTTDMFLGEANSEWGDLLPDIMVL